ncbi:hypothetical protein D1872_317220 [compost metagenome]
MAEQLGAELFDRHFTVHKIDDIGDAAANGFRALGFEFFGIRVQGSLNVLQVQIKH